MCNLGKKWRRGVVYKSKNTNIEIGLNTGGGGCFSDGHGVVYKSKHSKIGLNRGGKCFSDVRISDTFFHLFLLFLIKLSINLSINLINQMPSIQISKYFLPSWRWRVIPQIKIQNFFFTSYSIILLIATA